MSRREWIVCAPSRLWAAALRAAVADRSGSQSSTDAIHEAHNLDELSAQLVDHDNAVSLIEVRRANLSEVLSWLAQAAADYSSARFIALWCDDGPADAAVRKSIADALRAAGAVEVADSPRRLQHVLLIGRRHAEAVRPHNSPENYRSFADWAWAALPWQNAKRPIG